MPTALVLNTCNFSHHLSQAETSGFLIHAHDCYEFYYIISGDLHYLFDGTEYVLAPHTVIIIPPGLLHGIRVCSEATYNRYTFHFIPSFFPAESQAGIIKLLPTIQTLRSGESPLPCLIEHADRFGVSCALDEILSLSASDPAAQHLYAPMLFQALIVRLYLACAGSPIQMPALAKDDPPELASVLDYLRHHPSDRITLETLSERFFISRSHLNNLFRKYFHTSVMTYVTGQRLSYAQKLLLSGMSAAEAASAVGYTDYSTFYRSYSKHFGHPPGADKAATEDARDTQMLNLMGRIGFVDPITAMQAQSPLEQPADFPDIGFANNEYAPLE